MEKNRESEDEKLFKQIIKLIGKDNEKSRQLREELTLEQKERFDKYLAIQVLITEANSYRGKVIGMCVNLELVLGKILSCYFTEDDDKRMQLNYLIFDRMDLSTKYNKFKKILKSKFAKLWRLHSDELKAIEKLIEFRNDMAHSFLNTSNMGVDDFYKLSDEVTYGGKPREYGEQIQIGYYENFKIVFKSIKKQEVDDFYTSCYKAIEILESIAKQIINKYK